MQVSNVSESTAYSGELAEGSVAERRITELGKRELLQQPAEIAPRVIKKIKASTSQVNISLMIPEHISQGRFLIEIQVEREDSVLQLRYPSNYPEESSDLTLCFEGWGLLKVHREKLMEASAYFMGMFSGGYQESFTQTPIILKDVDPTRSLAILQFIYSGEIEFSLEDLPWINEFAQMWAVESLQDRCAQYLHHFFTPDLWVELVPYLAHYKDELVEYLAVNGEMLFSIDTALKLTPELFMAVLEHPHLTLRNEFELFKQYVRWCDANRPYAIPLKDFVKQAKYDGKLFLDQIRFDLLGSDVLLKKVGKYDIFSLNEMRILSKVDERGYICSNNKKRRNPLHLLMVPSFKTKKYDYEYLKYDKSAFHFYKCKLEENQLITEEVRQGKIRFKLVCGNEKNQFKIGLQRIGGFEDHRVNVEFSIINQFDGRRTQTVIRDIVDDSSFDMLSAEELGNPYAGWVVDEHVIIAAKVTYSKLEPVAQ